GAQRRRAGDQSRLMLDAARIAVVLGAGDAPAAPVGGVGHHHRIGARIGVVGAVVVVLPLVAGAHEPPGGLAAGVVAADRVLGAQLVGEERTAEADVVGHPHRLVEALGPDRLDLLDQRPGADAFDPDLLVTLENRLGHVDAPA